MKIIEVKDQQAGGQAGFEIFKQALAEKAQVFGLEPVHHPFQFIKH